MASMRRAYPHGGVMAEPSTVVTSGVRTHEPARQVIATFDNYADAERAVDYLSDKRFEVNRVAIVGRYWSSWNRSWAGWTTAPPRCVVPGRAPWSAR